MGDQGASVGQIVPPQKAYAAGVCAEPHTA